MDSPSTHQLSTPLLSGDDEFLEYEKDEEEGEEAEAERDSSSHPDDEGGQQGGGEGRGAAGPLSRRRGRRLRRRGGSSPCDPLLPPDSNSEAVEGSEGRVLRGERPQEEESDEDDYIPSSSGASRILTSCRRGGNPSAAVTASLVLLWVLAAAFVSYQGSLRSGSNDGDSTNHDEANVPSLRLTAELAKLSWLVYRFRNVDDPNLVCPVVEANYSHILDPTWAIPWDDNNSDNSNTNRSRTHEGSPTLKCHWYFHDATQGTQVLLLSTANYLAIVFSGTDDVQTSLTDVDLFTAQPVYFNATPGYDSRIRIHSGFHQAVFSNGILSNVTSQLRSALKAAGKDRSDGKVPWYRRWKKHSSAPGHLYLTGHSLGGANAILTGLALQATTLTDPSASSNDWDGLTIQSVSFGCPRIGNLYWRDFANQLSTSTSGSSGGRPIVRVVLGWDLVPRLPEFLLHVGHTIQLSKIHQWIVEGTEDEEESKGAREEVETAATSSSSSSSSASSFAPAVWNTSVYYQHYGEPSLGYAGVPLGWSATPFLWVPGALSSHSIRRYVSTLANLTESQWSKDFVRTPSPTPVDPKNSSTPSNNVTIDDDFYAEPPKRQFDEESNLTAAELSDVLAEFEEMMNYDEDDDDEVVIDANMHRQ